MPFLERWHSLVATLAIPGVVLMQATRSLPSLETSNQNEELLNDIQRLASTSQHQASHRGGTNPEVRNVIQAIDRVSGLQHPTDLHSLQASLKTGLNVRDTTCPEAGLLLLSTNHTLTNESSGSITFIIDGVEGALQFTFASGTTQINMVRAINSFTKPTGVEARVSSVDSRKLEIRSVDRRADAFVRVSQLGDSNPLIYSSLEDDTPSFDEIDFGLDGRLGDLDCDGVVSVFDLLLLFQVWGPCEGCAQDLDQSGAVDVGDLLIMLGWWG